MSDAINPRYYQGNGIELIDFLKSHGIAKDFCKGNVFKYVLRFDHKNGLEDLNKAQWYLDQLKQIAAEGVEPVKATDRHPLHDDQGVATWWNNGRTDAYPQDVDPSELDPDTFAQLIAGESSECGGWREYKTLQLALADHQLVLMGVRPLVQYGRAYVFDDAECTDVARENIPADAFARSSGRLVGHAMKEYSSVDKAVLDLAAIM